MTTIKAGYRYKLIQDGNYSTGVIPKGETVTVRQVKEFSSLIMRDNEPNVEYLVFNDNLEPADQKYFIIAKPVGNEKTYTVIIAPNKGSIKRRVNGVIVRVTEITMAEYNVLVKYIPNYFHQ